MQLHAVGRSLERAIIFSDTIHLFYQSKGATQKGNSAYAIQICRHRRKLGVQDPSKPCLGRKRTPGHSPVRYILRRFHQLFSLSPSMRLSLVSSVLDKECQNTSVSHSSVVVSDPPSLEARFTSIDAARANLSSVQPHSAWSLLDNLVYID